MKINKKQHITRRGVVKRNPESVKEIRIRVFSTYSRARRPWYVTKEKMTRKQFNNYIKDWKVQEFSDSDGYRIDEDETYSWEKGYICKLHD